jgi:Predicted hydrolases of HD superfamily
MNFIQSLLVKSLSFKLFLVFQTFLYENLFFSYVYLCKVSVRHYNKCHKSKIFLVKVLIGFHRCLKIAVVHDLAECIVGDITPRCGVDVAEKHHRETAAMKELADLAGSGGKELYELFMVIMYI